MTKDLFLVVAHCFFNQNKDIGMYQAKTVRTRAGSQKQTIRAGVLDKLSIWQQEDGLPSSYQLKGRQQRDSFGDYCEWWALNQ